MIEVVELPFKKRVCYPNNPTVYYLPQYALYDPTTNQYHDASGHTSTLRNNLTHPYLDQKDADQNAKQMNKMRQKK